MQCLFRLFYYPSLICVETIEKLKEICVEEIYCQTVVFKSLLKPRIFPKKKEFFIQKVKNIRLSVQILENKKQLSILTGNTQQKKQVTRLHFAVNFIYSPFFD